jgi:hypothetical protein
VDLCGLFYNSRMSEHQEAHHIGSLAEVYGRLKDEVHRVEERVERARRACVAAAIAFAGIVVEDDRLALAGCDSQSECSAEHLQYLLGTRELVELFDERSRLRAELEDVRVKLRGWLVHV